VLGLVYMSLGGLLGSLGNFSFRGSFFFSYVVDRSHTCMGYRVYVNTKRHQRDKRY